MVAGVGGALVTTKLTIILKTYGSSGGDSKISASTIGPFFARCAAPFNIPPFRRVGIRRCGPTFLGKVRRRATRMRTVMGGPSGTAFRGAVITLSHDKRLLVGITCTFDNRTDIGAGSRVRTLRRRLSPLLSGRDSSVDLGPGLFTHIGSMCRGRTGLGLSGRRGGLLRRACGKFIQNNTGLSTSRRTRLHGLGRRVSVLRLAFKRGSLGRAGTFRLIISGGRSLSNLPRALVTTTTAATGRTKLSKG